ncbi:MAG: DUF4160 domain-containing protein [Macromonas bipunctata]|jgi:hypothetical protein|nr:DUF4160 domain-containing protein [Macromonas bipunctata]
MGKVHTGNGWLIRVQGNEHPPVHVHVLHPDGKALIDVDGNVTNDGVPAKVIKQALAWVQDHGDVIATEWAHMNNPTKR